MEGPVDWSVKVELFEQIRREYEFGVGTVLGVARKLGVHRRMVREALASAVPARRKKAERKRPKLGGVIPFIDAILEGDARAPRKQRHTAHRIYQRIRVEQSGCEVSESTVRRYVREKKEALGLIRRETFVPQSYEWGSEAQADFYEAYADLGGDRQKLYVFSLRSMASGGAFHRAYPRPTQQAFLEAHELAFKYFGGVFPRVRYDNLAQAVKKILRGHQREETARFIAFRSHWRFTAEFCTPAAAQGSKARWDISGAITGYRCHKRGIWRSSTGSCWRGVRRTSNGRLAGGSRTSERRCRLSRSICCRSRPRVLTWPR